VESFTYTQADCVDHVPASNATAEQRTDAREEPKRRTRAAPRLRVAAQKVKLVVGGPAFGSRASSSLRRLCRFDRVQLTSGLTPQADIIADRRHVSKVP